MEAATSSYSVTGEFLRYTHSALVAKNHQKIRSKCLVDEFSFTDIFLTSLLYGVASYRYYEKVRRTMRTATVFVFFYSCTDE